MTGHPPENLTSGDDYGPTFEEWLNQHGKGRTKADNKPSPAAESDDDRAPLFSPDVRAIGWTVPLGIAWIAGAFIVAHLKNTSGHTGIRLFGVALMAWGIHIVCELSLAYRIRNAYPRLGMWEWLTHRAVTRAMARTQETAARAANSGCVLTLLAGLVMPALVAAFYLFFTIVSAAVQIWLTLVITATVTHIGVTVARHTRR